MRVGRNADNDVQRGNVAGAIVARGSACRGPVLPVLAHGCAGAAARLPRPIKNGSAQTDVADCCTISNCPLRSTRPTRDHKSVWLVAALMETRPCGASKSIPRTLCFMRLVFMDSVNASALAKR